MVCFGTVFVFSQSVKNLLLLVIKLQRECTRVSSITAWCGVQASHTHPIVARRGHQMCVRSVTWRCVWALCAGWRCTLPGPWLSASEHAERDSCGGCCSSVRASELRSNCRGWNLNLLRMTGDRTATFKNEPEQTFSTDSVTWRISVLPLCRPAHFQSISLIPWSKCEANENFLNLFKEVALF